MILVLSTRSSRTCDESWILTKPSHLLESLGPETDSFKFLSLVVFLAREGVQGHVQMLASRALPTAFFYAWTLNLSCQFGCWHRVDGVLSFVLRARFLYSIHCVTVLVSVQDCCCSTLDFHPKKSQCPLNPKPWASWNKPHFQFPHTRMQVLRNTCTTRACSREIGQYKKKICAYTSAYVHPHVRVYKCICIHIHRHTLYIYIIIHMHIYTHTCTHIYIRMHTHTYVQIENPSNNTSTCQAIS